MSHESVAVLDIRSEKITFLIGSKGVNGLFTLGGSHSESYEGYFTQGFFDEESFRQAVVRSISSVINNHNGEVKELYVGVPSAFITLRTIGHTITFPNKCKLSAQDVDRLYNSAQAELMQQGKCIRRSQMYFTLGDNRKYFSENELYGVSTNMLKGALCYYFVAEKFYDDVLALVKEFGFTKVEFLPSTLAQATYLLPEKKREGYAFLLDVGFLTSSISVIYGNGIVHEESFNCGVGTVLVSLMQSLGVEYHEAEEILAASNISGGNVPKDELYAMEQGDKQFRVAQINDVIKYALDVLCEGVEKFFTARYKNKATTGLTVNPISITGESIGYIKGAAEHISKQLNRHTEIVKPEQPFYDKPAYSSLMGLLALATAKEEPRKTGNWFTNLFKGFGGKK